MKAGSKLFPEAPEALANLGDEELRDLLTGLKAVSGDLKAGKIDLAEHYADLGSDEERTAAAMEEWRAAAALAGDIRAELKARAEAEDTFAEEAEQLDAAFAEEDEPVAELAAEDDEDEDAGDEKDGDEESEGEAAADETEAAAAEPEAITAAAEARRVRYPAVPKSHRATDGRPRHALVAAAGNTGIRAGAEMGPQEYADALIEIARRRGKVQKYQGGGRERILVASADLPFPEDRTLRARDPEGNAEKIKAIGSAYFGRESLEALVASGGICAPPTPFYDLPQLSTAERPVRDSLPGFRADRGAVSLPAPSTIGDITSAISVIEAADDALGGTFATKSCQAMDCPEWTEVAVGAVAHCREFGNLNARTWPEGVRHENEITMAAWARTAEGRLLDRMDTLLVNVTRAAVYGAASTLLYALQLSRVGIRNRLRMSRDVRFTVVLPEWVAEMFSLDLVNSQYGRFDLPQDQVGALLGRYGFNVVWHKDEGIDPAATAEVFEAQAAGAQVDWPGTTAIARLYPASHFLYLDGGSLELGLIRDSDLNHTNDYEEFGESWENIARVGPEEAGHRIAITLCPSGTVAAPDTSEFTCSAS